MRSRLEAILEEEQGKRLSLERKQRTQNLVKRVSIFAHEEAEKIRNSGPVSSSTKLKIKAFNLTVTNIPSGVKALPSLVPFLAPTATRVTKETFHELKPQLREEIRIHAMRMRQSLIQLLRYAEDSTSDWATAVASWKFGQTSLSDAELDAADAEALVLLDSPWSLFPVLTSDKCEGCCFHQYPDVLAVARGWDVRMVVRTMRLLQPFTKTMQNTLSLSTASLRKLSGNYTRFRCDCCPSGLKLLYSWKGLVILDHSLFRGIYERLI